jgi:hypothetical protein
MTPTVLILSRFHLAEGILRAAARRIREKFLESLNVRKPEGSISLKTALAVSFHVRVNSTNQLPKSMGVGRK